MEQQPMLSIIKYIWPLQIPFGKGRGHGKFD
jgi:hypothetical protein